MTIEKNEYNAMSKAFHWLTVALLTVQYALGWLMPGVHRGMQPERLMDLHMSFGIVIGAVILLRLIWRLVGGIPDPEPGLPRWQQRAAEGMHWLLYLLVGLMILTGWAYATGRGWAIEAFGVVPVPFLFGNGSSLAHVIGQLHSSLVWVLLAAIGLHAAAAFAHLVLWGDRVMKRMLPRLTR